PMRKIAASLAIIAAMAFISCAGEQKKTEPVKPDIIEEGWVSDSEFRVKVSGEADIESGTIENLQKSSEAAAVKKARETVVKNFVIVRMKQSPGAGTYAIVALGIDKDFRDIIEGGVVVLKSFSPDNRKCSVIYKVEKDNLKKTVEQKK
ncbi:MAG: hypothetical protein ACRCUT_08330, partial [Spirochaetota bacterium]